MHIMFDAVFSSGGATTYALVRASLDAPTHSSHRDPAVTPSADVRSVDTRLNEFANNFAQPEETLSFRRSGLVGPSVQNGAGSDEWVEPLLLGDFL